ncbi:hypothetical protein CHGG_03383 [Chaetomium globosum CBS 148.51]|uniref:DUF4045 domain-containing protein n=1 Tax=Chaetomium globosum (strain ATCC 6205 / CBS 148.51 / DSM 1962 / NBRC 6347 / NRRL 1970) TaxID=306901 RepID=Q2H8S1_CHAGB|nr:uncharacterized protein CHGG_03383 [Chaetomium globosum CBS 148.51]EAQ91448.1 hypothetical protein CHGG_03383 [Chaetomium globosum CBS 148.51]
MSDEVSDFLRSVELLKERREEEDEARSRDLEEKILQEKKERQARRAERARSISPQKSSPANTPPPTAHRASLLPSASGDTSLESPGLESSGSPRQRTLEPSSDAMNNSAAEQSSSPTKENDSPFDSELKRTSVNLGSPSIGMPSARSTLSWQRRPTSQASDRPKSRPLSMVAAENAARNVPGSAEPAEQTLSRDQIAQSLSGKDPSWFRQTADPGRGSGAFRKTQVEDQDTVDMPVVRTQLPGMSQESTSEPVKESPTARPVTPTNLSAKLGSPLPLTGFQRLDPPAGENVEDADTAAANRQSIASPPGRTSPTRPRSPTKGMGGFVQSAMMKRSDSVKRWSVNSPAGFQRSDSVRSSASTVDSAQRPTTPKTGGRPKSMLGGPSDMPTLAPSLSDEKEPESEEQAAPARPTTPMESKAKDDDETTSPPVSPSKTMDSRRWSPTKSSSWLDAALNKPESPKAKPAAPAPAQPAWMVELNKAKAQKATTDLARDAAVPKKTEVKTGGLMRSTPMGTSLKPNVLGGFPVIPPISTADDKPAISELRGSLRKASPTTEGPSETQGDLATATKTKPDIPSKKDFRANLKPRAPPPEPKAGDSAEELKNVVGSLRRTKTQNYVAPDELKDNILRGKAGLALTGGPKKTEHVDEFKEAILRKKDDFKKAQDEGRGITREPSTASEKSIPEGIAKKLVLQRTGTFSKQTPTTPDFPSQSPSLTGSNRSSHASTRSRHDIPGLGSGSASVGSPEPTREATANPVAPTRIGGKVGGLADRFNPALAGLLARGPPSAPGKADASETPTTTEPAGPGPQLTHMTKNRARGPRRKAPTSVAAAPGEPKETLTRAASEPERKPILSPPEPKKAMSFPPPKSEEFIPSPPLEQAAVPSKQGKPVVSPKPEKFTPTIPGGVSLMERRKSLMQDRTKLAGEVISLVDSSGRMPKEESNPVGQPINLVGSTPIKTRPRSPTKVHEQVAALAALNQQSPKPAEAGSEIASQPSSPKKLDMKRMSRFLDEQDQSSPAPEPVKSRSSSPVKGRSDSIAARPMSLVRDRAESITARPTSMVRDRSESITGRPLSLVRDRSDSFRSRSSSPVKDRFPGLESPSIAKQAGNEQGELKPALPIKNGAAAFGGIGLGLTQAAVSPRPTIQKPAEAELPPPLPPKTARPLPAPPATQRAQLIQITAEGKKMPVPSHHERVLFEREMYLCPHNFIDGTGRKATEVYFWAGDEVPESQVDDAHLFAAREARAYGGKLVKLTQGKETSEFLQALGGIVIVRRGSSNKYDSLAPNMLCGRRYLSQVAFDEVDFSPLSLCSGFPYLIAQQGKCYLWKGKGSDVEELGCARLVGMDLALMGELLEVEEGNEPDSFWHIFNGGTRPTSADHWRLKPSYDKYCTRLFCANAADKHQTDLLPSNIYVLDAFFEMYIIVGARSQHQYAAFRNALDFAQEYAILAAGMEDRPFVPISTVVLEGIPRDLKSVFRKWRDGNSPTVMHASPQGVSGGSSGGGGGGGGPTPSPLKRARSLRIVPLTQALQALAE